MPEHVETKADARYVYAVIPKVRRKDFGPVGIGHARVYSLSYQDISALVHDCSAAPYPGEEQSLARWVRAHSNVIDLAWAEAGSILPMRFGVTVKADAERSSEENVRRWLAAEYHQLRAKLEEFRDKVELGVQILWDPAVIAERVARGSAEAQALRAEMAGKSKGLAYFHEHKIAEAVKRELERKASRDVEASYERLREHAEGVHVNRVRKLNGKLMIANLSLLARKEQVEVVGAVLGQFADEEGVEVVFSGPWPPATQIPSARSPCKSSFPSRLEGTLTAVTA
jgi:hypothetical protein